MSLLLSSAFFRPLLLFDGLLLCFLVQVLLGGGLVVWDGSYIIHSCLVVGAVYLCEKGGPVPLSLVSSLSPPAMSSSLVVLYNFRCTQLLVLCADLASATSRDSV